VKLFCVPMLCALLAACGGGSSPSASAPVSTPSTVHGVAATGNAIVGRIYVKDVAGQEMFVDTTDGSYSIVVDGMTAPFLLKAQWTANGAPVTLYSFAATAGTANITPLTEIAVSGAAGSLSLDTAYAAADAATYSTIAAHLPAAVAGLKKSLGPLLAQYGVGSLDPLTGAFAADHTGLDALLDSVRVSVSDGIVVVTSKSSGATLLQAPTADLAHAVSMPAWTAQDATNASEPAIAIDADGNALVVWSDAATGVIQARFVTTPAAIATTLNPSGLCITPRVAFDHAGNAIAVWAQYENQRNDIWARRYVASTQTWSTPLRVSSATAAADAYVPDLGVDGAGNAIVVWHQGNGQTNHFDEWVATYDAMAATWSAPVLASDGVDSAYGGRVGINANGRAIVAWQQETGDGTTVSNAPTELWARTVSATGLWSAPRTISTIPGAQMGVYGQISVAMDGAGNGAVVWVQGAIQAAIFSATDGWQAAQGLLSTTTDSAYAPQVAFDASGNALAVWQEQDGFHAFGGASRYVPGSGWSASTQFASWTPGDLYTPALAVDGAGNATVVWYAASMDGPAQVMSNRYLAASGWGTPILLSATTTDGFSMYPVPVVAANAVGQTVTVWGVNSN